MPFDVRAKTGVVTKTNVRGQWKLGEYDEIVKKG